MQTPVINIRLSFLVYGFVSLGYPGFLVFWLPARYILLDFPSECTATATATTTTARARKAEKRDEKKICATLAHFHMET